MCDSCLFSWNKQHIYEVRAKQCWPFRLMQNYSVVLRNWNSEWQMKDKHGHVVISAVFRSGSERNSKPCLKPGHNGIFSLLSLFWSRPVYTDEIFDASSFSRSFQCNFSSASVATWLSKSRYHGNQIVCRNILDKVTKFAGVCFSK